MFLKHTLALSVVLSVGGIAHAATCNFKTKDALFSYLTSSNYYLNKYDGWTTRMVFSGSAEKPKLKLQRTDPKGKKQRARSVRMKVVNATTVGYRSERGSTFGLRLSKNCKLRFVGNNHLVSRH